jgi:hypothetical protein
VYISAFFLCENVESVLFNITWVHPPVDNIIFVGLRAVGYNITSQFEYFSYNPSGSIESIDVLSFWFFGHGTIPAIDSFVLTEYMAIQASWLSEHQEVVP